MTEARKGEIALLFLKNKIKEEGVRIGPHLKRQVYAVAADIGIEPEEAMEFAEGLVREAVEASFKR